jgi:DNA-binding IscR family transcriptional regulator
MTTKANKKKPLTEEQIEYIWIAISERYADEFDEISVIDLVRAVEDYHGIS